TEIKGTSRTDAGVHAMGQMASFEGDIKIPTERLAYVLNNHLPGSIRIKEAIEKPLGFHARFDAKGKKYIYRIMNCSQRDPFKRNFYYFVEKPLDLPSMQKAAAYIEGKNDFKCFQAAGSTEKETTVRTVKNLSIKKESDEITIEITGDGFLYNMVRIIAGTLVDVGHGKISPLDMPLIIKSKDRRKAGHTAPPQGLYLAEVFY
ncbi:MAG TPA: tRNA pseudouridine(38-40) synthase TruA, partial [Bacillota bacterium]|nr:tRNA pseudouridine(38-40) synthase TruA [Bacillota bacterium]